DGAGTVALTGQGVTGNAQLSISPTTLNFGSVPVGMTATQTISVENTGNLNVTITKAAPPSLPFVVNTPLPEGQVLVPDEDVQIQVTFSPTATGAFTNQYVISSDDGHGAHTIALSGTGARSTGGTPLPSAVSGGWIFNGSAAMSGSDLVLTPATANLAGSAVYSTPLPANGLTASFTATENGGTGAEGLTFALLDAASTNSKSVGGTGNLLGF